jgi:hypothetical protein
MEKTKKINWRDDKSIEFLKSDLLTPPVSKEDVAQIMMTADGKAWLVPAGLNKDPELLEESKREYLVESETGMTGIGYTQGWYRKYKSGWVEQGFHCETNNNRVNVTLPTPMGNNNYTVVATSTSSGNAAIVSATMVADFRQPKTIGIRSGANIWWSVYIAGQGE